MKKEILWPVVIIGLLSQIIQPYNLSAQDLHNIALGGGISSVSFRDQGFSPLRYSGIGFAGEAQYSGRSAQKSEYFLLSFHQAGCTNTQGNHADYIGFAFKNYTFYHAAKAPEDHVVFGWSNNNSLSTYSHSEYRNYSSRFSYHTAFGPAASYLKRFSLFEREFSISALSDVQLLGFYFRPSYVSSEPEGYLDPENSDFSAFLKSLEFFHPGRAIDIGINVNLAYSFLSGNEISAGYHYNYTSICRPESVSLSKGYWVFRLITKL